MRTGGLHVNGQRAASTQGNEPIVSSAAGEACRGRGVYGHALQAASARGHESVVRLLLEKVVFTEGGMALRQQNTVTRSFVCYWSTGAQWTA
jgi:hypothetical protein